VVSKLFKIYEYYTIYKTIANIDGPTVTEASSKDVSVPRRGLKQD